jgi:Zn ribbon nucleic-acid-binding protein
VCVCANECVHCGQKKVSDPLELESRVVVSSHVVALSSTRTASALNC